MRLIDADALKIIIEQNQLINAKLSVYDVLKIIDNAPTVLHDNYSMGYQDGVRSVLSERLQGKWIFHKDYNESCRYGCNQCGNLNNIQSNYCPNCGAEMKKG